MKQQNPLEPKQDIVHNAQRDFPNSIEKISKYIQIPITTKTAMEVVTQTNQTKYLTI